MTKITTGDRVTLWVMVLAAVLFTVLWRMGLLTAHQAGGWGMVIEGVSVVPFALSGNRRPRWPIMLAGACLISIGLGWIMDMWLLRFVGSMVMGLAVFLMNALALNKLSKCTDDQSS